MKIAAKSVFNIVASVAISVTIILGSAAHAQVQNQDQGWGAELRNAFYHTPQGSHMMPADLFAALEQPGGAGFFSDANFLSQFGFLATDGPSDLNPMGYPIGFALDPQNGQIGLTCAACHTAEVEVNGARLRIDGAPGHLDFDAFYQSLAQAVALTLLDAEAFGRFAANFGVKSEADAGQLQARLAAFNIKLTGDATLRKPAVASGSGRVDALTQIVNALAVKDQAMIENLYPVAAPTSYPALWIAPDLEFVQWVPVAASPIARNGGQVLGVFGNTNLNTDDASAAFGSSMRLNDLHELEEWLKVLEPPDWDTSIMGSIDETLRDQGAELFEANCASCHNMAPYRRTDPAKNFFGETFIEIGRVDFREVGTDPAYVRSMLTRNVATNDTTAPIFGGAPFVPAISFFGGTVRAAVKKAMLDANLSQEQVFALNGMRFFRGEDGLPVPYSPDLPPTYLKASPLAGVWATGPYLHNGSVPTIYELLSPPADRRAVFWTGGRELDLERLGYVSDEVAGLFRFDTRIPGNGNMGHEYPAGGLSHDDRMAIIEYLKSQ